LTLCLFFTDEYSASENAEEKVPRDGQVRDPSHPDAEVMLEKRDV